MSKRADGQPEPMRNIDIMLLEWMRDYGYNGKEAGEIAGTLLDDYRNDMRTMRKDQMVWMRKMLEIWTHVRPEDGRDCNVSIRRLTRMIEAVTPEKEARDELYRRAEVYRRNTLAWKREHTAPKDWQYDRWLNGNAPSVQDLVDIIDNGGQW